MARSDAKVLITGESGVGKEVVARAIHSEGPPESGLRRRELRRSAGNAARIRAVRTRQGSFTGAYRDKPGKLEMANHGTVFLDEVGEMTLRMQGFFSGSSRRASCKSRLRTVRLGRECPRHRRDESQSAAAHRRTIP